MTDITLSITPIPRWFRRRDYLLTLERKPAHAYYSVLIGRYGSFADAYNVLDAIRSCIKEAEAGELKRIPGVEA